MIISYYIHLTILYIGIRTTKLHWKIYKRLVISYHLIYISFFDIFQQPPVFRNMSMLFGTGIPRWRHNIHSNCISRSLHCDCWKASTNGHGSFQTTPIKIYENGIGDGTLDGCEDDCPITRSPKSNQKRDRNSSASSWVLRSISYHHPESAVALKIKTTSLFLERLDFRLQTIWTYIHYI